MEKQILNPPFFLFEGASLDIFNDLAALESKIEPKDWLDDVYQIFDASGRKLTFQINVENKKVWLSTTAIEHVRFREAGLSNDDTFSNCLKQSYQAYFNGFDENLDNEQLMHKLIAKIGMS